MTQADPYRSVCTANHDEIRRQAHEDGRKEGVKEEKDRADKWAKENASRYLTTTRKCGIVILATSAIVGLYVAHLFETGSHYGIATALLLYTFGGFGVSTPMVLP